MNDSYNWDEYFKSHNVLDLREDLGHWKDARHYYTPSSSQRHTLDARIARLEEYLAARKFTEADARELLASMGIDDPLTWQVQVLVNVLNAEGPIRAF